MIHFETDRLMIRSYQSGDENAILSLILNNKQHLKYVLSDWVLAMESLEDAKKLIKKMRAGFLLKNIFALGVWEKTSQVLIGEIVFFRINWKFGVAEIGSYIDCKYQGHGFISEAKSECIKYIFKNYELNRVEAICQMDNYASRRVNEKCGFTTGESIVEGQIKFFITKQF